MSELKHLERGNPLRLLTFRPPVYRIPWLDHGATSKPEAACFAAAQAFNVASYLLNGPRTKADANGKNALIPTPQQIAFTTGLVTDTFTCTIKCYDHLGRYREISHAKTSTSSVSSRVDAVIPWIIVDIVFKIASNPAGTVSLGLDHGNANMRFPIPWDIRDYREIAAVQLTRVARGFATSNPAWATMTEGAFVASITEVAVDLTAKTITVAMGARTEPVGASPPFADLQNEMSIYPGRNTPFFTGVLESPTR